MHRLRQIGDMIIFLFKKVNSGTSGFTSDM